MTGAALRFFHISPEWCGQERLVQLFRLNGHQAACHESGRLAQDILFSQGRGVAPLAAWPRARLFCGLYRHAPHWQRPLDAWRSIEVLSRHFPQARFILTTREVDGWLYDRLTRQGGAIARAHAHDRGVAPADLPDLWLAEWQAHLAALDARFGDDPRLIRVDIDRESPQDLCARLDALLPMGRHPPGRAWLPAPEPGQPARLHSLYRPASPPASPPVATGMAEWLADIAGFCLRGLAPDAGGLAGVSRFYCRWDGGRRVQGRDGSDQPIVITESPALEEILAVARPGVHFKLGRAEGVINDILRLGRCDPVRIDMEDSRWMGAPQGDPLGLPVLCHNRRHDARNVVLWPLPGQHDIGLPGFDPHQPADDIRFEDKLDRLVWRGMISGSLMRPGVRPGPASHVYLTRLREAETEAARAEIRQDLARTSRLALVRRLFDDPDFDLGVVMAWGFRDLARDPLLAPYCKPREGAQFFRRFRYQLCMGGYDHGSNFISAINSRSVLLAEQDGWDVFYSGRFKPWKHFIPVARYGADIKEKLAWARRNPDECKAMSAAARAEAAPLADPDLRRALLGQILDGLAAAG